MPQAQSKTWTNAAGFYPGDRYHLPEEAQTKVDNATGFYPVDGYLRPPALGELPDWPSRHPWCRRRVCCAVIVSMV